MANPITDLRELTVAAGQANTALDALERQALEAGVSTQKLSKLFKDVRGEASNLADANNRLGLSQQALTRYNRDGAAAFMARYNALIQSERATRSLQGANNKMGTAFNQASFQVNDFFVQISSGTDAMVALGQQGSQLAQILTMFGGKLAVVGAVASVLVPIVTSVARSLDLFGDAAISAMKRAETSSNKMLESFEKIREASDLTGAVSGLSNLAEVLDTRVLMSIRATGEELKKQFGRDDGGFWQFLNRVQQTGLAFTTGGFEGAAAQKLKMMGLEAKEAGLWIERALVASEKQLDVLSETLLMRKSVGVIQDKEFNLLVNIAAKRAEELASIRKSRSTLKEKVDLTFLELMYGQDSVELREHENFLAQEALKAKLKSAKASDDEIKKQLEMLRVQQETVGKIKEKEKAEKAAEKAQKEALESAREMARIQAETLGFEIQALKKQQLTSDTYNDIVEKEIERYKLQKGITEEMAKEAVYAEAIAAKTTAVKASLAGTRGSKGVVKEAKDPLGSEIKANDKLIAQAKVKALFAKDTWDYYSRMLAIQTDGAIVDDARLGKLREQYEQIQEINKALERREELQDALKTSAKLLGEEVGRVFASKDKPDWDRMLRELLKVFLEMQVAITAFSTVLQIMGVPKDAAGRIAGVLAESSVRLLDSFAKGGVFDQGVQKFANGGVVTQPTLFPMASGIGLMGEAGPEAIMPLKRGRDGKLGVAANDNGGTVVVNQSFNFAANGDDSVKKIIAQEAPKIAQMTKRVIIDDRRRGGSTRGAFA